MNARSAGRRRIGMGLVAVCAILLTSACAAGQRAQTADEVPAIDGTNGTIGTLSLQEVAIKTPPAAPSYNVGDTADLQLAIVNTGHTDDTLQSVSSPAVSNFAVFANAVEANAAEASASASPSAPTSPSSTDRTSASATGSPTASASASASASSTAPSTPVSLVIAAGQLLSFNVTGKDAVLVLHLSKKLFPATTVPITFTFANAGAVTLTVPVQISQDASPPGLIIPAPESSTAG